MALNFGTVSSGLDLETTGKRGGNFGLAHSDNRFAFSTIQSPLGVIRGGDGPTALVCAGNHGDEYEGQIIVRRLFEMLEPDDLAGRLILAPALNMPAVQAISRTSPLDGGNLNRSFPGQAYGGPTREIAGFVATQLMPLADVAVDLHSGGSGSDYLDCAYLCLSNDPARNAQTRDLATVMGLANTMVVPPSDTPGDFDGSAHAAGCAMISCELGGEGKVSLRALEAGWHGVLRILAHSGVLNAAAAQRLGADTPPKTRFLDLGAEADTITAQSHGLIEPMVQIGAPITAGQPVARLRNLHDLAAAPDTLFAAKDGILAILRAGAIVAPGDHFCVICPEISDARLDALLQQTGQP
ncbi:succinylglutamate desuccinylase/aspartoacylase family protein [Roseovarius dicentrarchi]|uniref:succinylglutamate desuccinylase/aspartoacylase family protein n=1 Tax=Roseovarius dicentrarchi TaxID=2250573 RepID=UPI000DEB82C1|nr:succinylglutamate desuccinylase/aspartoacylase family protein [Roseovarius dicentrarchi]